MSLFKFMQDGLVPLPDALEITKPFWGDFTKVWTSAWAAWGSLPEEARAQLSQTPLIPPVVLFGFAQSFAKEIFAGREAEGIVLCEDLHGVVGFYLGVAVSDRDAANYGQSHDEPQESLGKLLVRFNSLNRHCLVRNTGATGHRKDLYYSQEPLFGLDNSATRVTCGSVSNPSKTGLESVQISCQMGDDLLYKFPVDGSDGVALPGPSQSRDPLPSDLSQERSKKHPK